MSEPIVTMHLVISGRVQGIGYRETMRAKAQALGVMGWVRNRIDGTVEATIQGDEEAVESLVRWGHRGPPGAHVKAITATLLDSEERFIAFTRWPTV